MRHQALRQNDHTNGSSPNPNSGGDIPTISVHPSPEKKIVPAVATLKTIAASIAKPITGKIGGHDMYPRPLFHLKFC
jgi:hypothetical protein